MEETKGLEIEPKVAETTTPPQTEVKPPTSEELQSQIAELKVKYEQADKGLKTAQLTISQRDKLLKEQTDLRTEINEQKEYMKILAAIVAEQKGTDPDGLEPEKKQDLLKVFEAKTVEIEHKKQLELAKQKQDEYNRQADAIYTRAKTVITNKKDLKMVEMLLISGDATGAEDLVTESEKEKKPVVEKPVESEEVRINKLVEEKLRKVMEEKGLLVSDEGKPSSAGTSAQEAYALFAKGKIGRAEAEKRGATFS
jgi:hypothetical protein